MEAELSNSANSQEQNDRNESFVKTVREALKQRNQLHSCNITAKHLKQAYEKVHQQKISQKEIKYHKRQFPAELCRNELFKKLCLQEQLQKCLMIRFPLNDLKHNYDHYVTIFRESYDAANSNSSSQANKKVLWFLVHSWQNVYSLNNWVFDVNITSISQSLRDQNIDPINKLRDFIGNYNKKWFDKFYDSKHAEKQLIMPRFQEIFSMQSNDERLITQIEWYSTTQ